MEFLAGIGTVTAVYLALHHFGTLIGSGYNALTAKNRAREDELNALRARIESFSEMLHAQQALTLPAIEGQANAEL